MAPHRPLKSKRPHRYVVVVVLVLVLLLLIGFSFYTCSSLAFEGKRVEESETAQKQLRNTKNAAVA